MKQKSKKAMKEFIDEREPTLRKPIKILMLNGFDVSQAFTLGHQLADATEGIIFFDGTEFDIVRAMDLLHFHGFKVGEGRRVYSPPIQIIGQEGSSLPYHTWAQPSNAVILRKHAKSKTFYCQSNQ